MEQYKRAQVILLPTKNKSKLVLTSTPILTLLTNESIYDLSEIKSQNIYIISDDEIKDGDWFINLLDNSIYQATNWIYVSTCKKIIATTDTSLTLNTYYEIEGEQKVNLPQPSQQFIEKYIESYNKDEVITDVLVEYENKFDHKHYVDDQDAYGYDIYKNILKINPKDNTITIKKLKDNWNREEVIFLLKKFNRDIAGLCNKDDNWIEKNL